MLAVLSIIVSTVLALASALPQQECMVLFASSPESCCTGLTPPYIDDTVECSMPDFTKAPPNHEPMCENIKCGFKNYMTDDGEIDKTAFINAMQSYYTNDAYKSTVPTAYEKCTGLESSAGHCPIAKFGICFYMQMFKNCPDNGNADCTAAKGKVDKCTPTN